MSRGAEGEVSSEVALAARRAVSECLRVRAGERFLIVYERQLGELARAMDVVGRENGASVEIIELVSDPAALDRIAPALDRCVVSAFVATYGANVAVRRAMVMTHGRRRHAHMIGLNDAVIRQSLGVDPTEMRSLGDRLIGRMRPTSVIRVQSPSGTALTVECDPKNRWHNEHGIVDGPGWTNLPAGEVITSPASVDGIFVPDGGVWMTDGSPLDRAALQRMRLRFAQGKLVDAEGPEKEVRALIEHVEGGQDARRVGQVVFGTNTGVVAPIGVSCQDIKLRGFHLILGFSAAELTGASWNGNRLVQLLQRRANVWVDEVPVLANGRYTV